MRQAGTHFRKLVLVCQNQRPDSENCCMNRGAGIFFDALKAAIKAECPGVRVSRSGCLDNCATGPTVVIMPDDVWLGEVSAKDIPAIVALVKQ